MRRTFISMTLLLGALACGAKGEDDDSASGRDDDESPKEESVSWDPKEITPQMLALGDSLFHGLIGATSCQACHGADGKQATVAPDLTDAEWLHSDGTWEGIHNTLKSGVMAPKQFTSIMPPYGGAPLKLEQSRAVTAYVYSLGHKM
jgi:mono/diheme cytochrome c family protein